ncbi:serine hydrolase [Massilia sp.]|uniref:serine hydrolase n=1 Tax=Massilia sp. TaxID=1882437 RepID=UPI00352E9D7F
MNLRRILPGLCAFALTLHAAADERITRIENGLREPVAVRGAPARTMRLLDRMRDLHVPGVSIAFIDHGRIAWTRAYGVADVDSGRPVTPATLFQVASISKSVAAVATVKSRIDLDADVSRRLPDSALTARHPVTVRALLSHTAGVSDEDLAGYPATAACPTLQQELARAEVKWEPGSRYAYSSLGYGVLQQVLADTTGRPFDALARDTVFAPLGMRDSLFASTLPAALAPRAAKGHALDGTPIAGGWHCYPEEAAAGLWSTAPDLARFAIALQDRRYAFLTRQQIDALLTPVRDDYGLGFELGHAGREPVFHHSGSNAGYKAQLWAYTRTGQGAVILTNGDYGATLIAELMRAIATEYGWEDWRPIERTAVPANTALFDRYTGSYAVSNVVLRVERRGDVLTLAGPPLGPEPVELIPAGDADFFMREKDATLHFDTDADGRVDTLTFVDGRPRPGRRIDPAQVSR